MITHDTVQRSRCCMFTSMEGHPSTVLHTGPFVPESPDEADCSRFRLLYESATEKIPLLQYDDAPNWMHDAFGGLEAEDAVCSQANVTVDLASFRVLCAG